MAKFTQLKAATGRIGAYPRENCSPCDLSLPNVEKMGSVGTCPDLVSFYTFGREIERRDKPVNGPGRMVESKVYGARAGIFGALRPDPKKHYNKT